MTLPTYQYSGACYVATAGQTTFALTTDGGNAINYARPDHIKVRTSADSGNTWTDLVLGTDWLFADPPVSVVLTTPAVVGIAVDIYRDTPLSEDFIRFEDGNLLTAGQLNDFDDWQLYIDQEILDRVENLTAPDINLADTDDLPEGSVNLYYTDERVQSVIDGQPAPSAGVTKLKAGPNVTLDPATGVGEVTISSTGGGGGGSSYWELDGANLHPKGDSTDVHIGDDNIVLDHSGAATFKGNIEAAGYRIDQLTTLP